MSRNQSEPLAVVDLRQVQSGDRPFSPPGSYLDGVHHHLHGYPGRDHFHSSTPLLRKILSCKQRSSWLLVCCSELLVSLPSWFTPSKSHDPVVSLHNAHASLGSWQTFNCLGILGHPAFMMMLPFGASPEASWSFTSAFCAPVLGQLADKFGRRSVLLASLLGAGLANLGQACAGTYYQLLGWRAFSGIWAAVGNSAQVYLSDVCSPLVLPDFMSKLSAVPSLAMTFGPGLGGGLSKFGLEIPVLVDGLLSLLAAGLCFIYLPESPVWLQSRGHPAATASDPKAPSKVASIPAGVRVLAISGFFSGINFGVVVSMTAIFLDAKLQFDSLHVGFTFVLSALATLATSIWITGFVQKSVGLKCCAVLGSLLNGLLSIAMAVIPGAWPTIIVMCLARVGMTLRAATNGTILANFTDPSNRGTIFAQQQFATNMGRLVGPVVAGHLAVRDPVLLPILFGSSCGLISGLILLAVPMPEGPKEVKQKRLHGFTDLGGGSLKGMESGMKYR